MSLTTQEQDAVKYLPLMKAAGLLHRDTTPYDALIWAGMLIDDPVVDERARALGFEPGTCVMAATLFDYEEIIRNMSQQEKLELLKRIGR